MRPRRGPRGVARRLGPPLAILAGVLFLIPVASSGIPVPFASPAMSTAPVPANLPRGFDWPELHATSSLLGYTPNSTLSVSNAPLLGVRWAADLYSAALDSPVLTYDPLLGETVAYIGTESGNVLAINVANGEIVWSQWFGSPIRGTPIVHNGSLYVVTSSTPAIYKLNATTGAVACHLVAPETIESTPTIVTPRGGVPTLYVGSDDTPTSSGPLLAMTASSCSLEWEFTGYNRTTGSWIAVSYGVDANGIPLVIFGTADPDSSVYALNALTGAEVWRYQTYNPGKYDVGAGAVVSPPGANGFAGGVVYVPNKYGIMYALGLTTGGLIWSTDFNQIAGVTEGGRSTAALDGTNLVFGYKGGLFDLNADTGAVTWQYKDSSHTEVLSSPAIVGAPGREVVAAADIGGHLDVVSLASGTLLYRYATGGYIAASPAITDGNILLASSDQFLYDFAVGGGNDPTLPTTGLTSPTSGASLANPLGDLVVSGVAADPVAVAAVHVAVQSGGPSGSWWDSATGSWMPGPYTNSAKLASPGAASTRWNLSYPVPSGGGVYRVVAYAVSTSGQSDIKGATAQFSVLASTSGPHVRAAPTIVGPGESVTINGAGFGHNETVAFSLNAVTIGSTTSSSTGVIRATKLKVPSTTVFGLYSIVATGSASHKTATAPITVANSWEQPGYGPAGTNYAPNDPVLDQHVYVGGRTWLYLAWHYDAGAPLNASPVVVDGVAYAASVTGQLTALDDQNGGWLWTWTLPSGAALLGAPAVDPTRSIAFVTAADGSLTAVSTVAGAARWTVSVGGTPTPPVFAGGRVYVASSSGLVASFSELSGALVWSATLASQVTAAVALDGSNGYAFVGESNGDEVALSTTTGAVLWSFASGGPVRATATVFHQQVYFGSGSGTVYALVESSGAVVWSYSAGSPIGSSGALLTQGTPGAQPEYVVGALNGEIYALDTSTGGLNFVDSWAAAIVGVGAVDGVIAVTTASGDAGAARAYTNLVLWNYQTGAALVTAPVIVDGTVYVAASDGDLYAFTSFGQPPD